MNNIIVTSANSLYFDSLLTLINSVHLYSLNLIQKIYVYNLGLEKEEINRLNKLKNVSVIEFPNNIIKKHSKFLEPKQHVYKPYCLYSMQNYGDNILWLDAGIMALKPLNEIFKIIQEEHIFMVGDSHLNITFTSKECINIMKASDRELQDTHLSSGILGYKNKGNFQFLIDEAYEYSLIENCVNGDQNNHRHDQSVYSILASRYNIKKQNIDIYGYWTDINRNINTAKEKGAVLFVHRRSYREVNNLIYVN